MDIVLFQPEIPQNTGNIVRTCRATKSRLILVKPLGFSLSNRYLKRAGLDYWDEVEIVCIDNLEHYLQSVKGTPYFFSSKGKKYYTDIQFTREDALIFGSETAGLPAKYHENPCYQFCKIPMHDGARCLNLSNSVAIAIYEAHRQLNLFL